MDADTEIRELGRGDLDALLSRRRGLGSAVLQQLLARCWAARCYKVMLLSGSHRDAAHEFYERSGFDKHAKQGFVIRK